MSGASVSDLTRAARPRIVYIGFTTVPGTAANSIQTMKMCSAFAQLGAEVTLLVPRRPERDTGVTDLFEHYGLDGRFRIEWLPWPRVPGRGYVFSLIAAYRARKLSPALVFGRHALCCAAAAGLGLPTVYETHAPPPGTSRRGELPFRYLLRRKALRRVVTISGALRNYYVERWPEIAHKVVAAHDGADPGPTMPVAEPGSGAGFRVGYVGHLYPGKGMELVDEISERMPDVEFHVVGGTDRDRAYWGERLRSRPNIQFHGFLAPAQATQAMSRFHVLLAPYQPSALGDNGRDVAQWMSPLKIFEYMSAAKPIVCSDLPVLREVLRDGSNAVLCPATNAASWVAALRQLQTRPELGRELGAQARRDFLREHTWTARAERIAEGLLGVAALQPDRGIFRAPRQ